MSLAEAAPDTSEIKLITLDPGHFHAALFQKERLPEIADEAAVYAPLGPDLAAHLNRIAGFNSRAAHPTSWKLRVYAGPDYWEKLLAEHAGNVVVFSGKNRGKIGRMAEITRRHMHALADKPWIIEAADLPALASLLDAADRDRVIAYDGMTQRYEISCILQRELVNDVEVFGGPLEGTAEEPGAYLESVHYLLKLVAGAPNLRPPWFFDIQQQGEGLTDVGTHLVDLVQWTLFPEQAIDHDREIRVLSGSRWPTVLSLADFQRVTGEREFPGSLKVEKDELHYFCNNSVTYTIRGIHTKLDIEWGFEAAPGTGDSERAIFRGSRSRIDLLQGKEENYRPEVYVAPNRSEDRTAVGKALAQKLNALAGEWPGLGIEEQAQRFRITIPDRLRIGHEAHFALVAKRFLGYVRDPGSLPRWEKPNMLAKYYVTTRGVELARAAPEILENNK